MLEIRGKKRRMVGIVTSDRMEKTRVVSVKRTVRHPLYEKVLRRTTVLYVHDEKNESKMGDLISVIETRPLSKLKRWRLERIITKGVAPIRLEAVGSKKEAG